MYTLKGQPIMDRVMLSVASVLKADSIIEEWALPSYKTYICVYVINLPIRFKLIKCVAARQVCKL